MLSPGSGECTVRAPPEAVRASHDSGSRPGWCRRHCSNTKACANVWRTVIKCVEQACRNTESSPGAHFSPSFLHSLWAPLMFLFTAKRLRKNGLGPPRPGDWVANNEWVLGSTCLAHHLDNPTHNHANNKRLQSRTTCNTTPLPMAP